MADPRALPERSIGRYLVYAGPLVWAVLIVFHPNPSGDSPYEGISDVVDRWLFVHVAQLILTPFLFLAVWRLLDGLSSATATISRAALVVWTVFFSAYDSIQGIATGILTRWANDLAGEEQAVVARAIEFVVEDSKLAGNYFRDWDRGRRLLADRRDRGGRGPAQGRLREGRCHRNQPVGCSSCAHGPGGDWVFRALPRWRPP